jgi:hypothetical protein
MLWLKLQLLPILTIGLIYIGHSQNNCASLTPEQSEFGYKRLTNRCEGFYNPGLSGNLQVVSFIRGGDIEFRWDKKTELLVFRIDSLQSPLNIRAVSLQHNVFYQMDALLSGNNRSLNWPIEPYIYSRNIKPGELGIYGWSGREDDKIFSPVSVIEKGNNTNKEKVIVLKIRTVLDLTNFRWSLVRANNTVCDSAARTFQVFEGSMNAGDIIEIKISQFTETMRSLCLEIQYRPENSRWQSEIIKIKI